MPNSKKNKQQKQQAKPAPAAPKPQPKKTKAKKQGRKAQAAPSGVAVSYAKGLNQSVGRYNKLTNKQTVSGSDYLDDITVTGSSGTAILTSYKLNPLGMLPSSRLAGFARLYEKYRITNLRVKYEPQSSSGTAGQVLMWFEPNPEINWTVNGTQLLNEVSAMQCRKMTPPWVAASMDVPSKVMTNAKAGRWFVNPANAEDPADTYAGLIYIGADNLNSGGPTMTFGRLIIEWTVEFFDAQNSTQSGDAFSVGQTDAASAGDATPFGLGYDATSGDPGLFSLTSTGTDNQCAFSVPGNYTIEATSSGTGGAGLTASSTITLNNASNLSTLIYSASSGAQKVWRIQVTVLIAGGGFLIHDAGGTTHPNGPVFFTIVRTADLTLTRGESREKSHALRMEQLENKLRLLQHYSSLDMLSATTTVTGTIQDGNDPLETVSLTSNTAFTGILPVEVIPPPSKTLPSSSSKSSYGPPSVTYVRR